MTLTAQEYRDKIEMVKKDIEKLESIGGGDRKMSILNDYIEYLKDELKEAEIAERSNKGT
jgi:hypothetical protein